MAGRATGWIGHAITGILVVCAILVTVVTLRRELAPPRSVSTAETIVYRPTAAPNAHLLSSVGHRMGPANARTVIVEFSDFQCPYCSALESSLDQLRKRHPNDLAIVYRHYPLPLHRFALDAAIASECAGVQGAFEPYASLLFRMQDSIGHTTWSGFAAQAGVADTVAFDKCRALPSSRQQVDADIAVGGRMAIAATPTLFLGDEMMVGAIPVDQLETWIRSSTTHAAGTPK